MFALAKFGVQLVRTDAVYIAKGALVWEAVRQFELYFSVTQNIGGNKNILALLTDPSDHFDLLSTRPARKTNW